MTLSRITHGDLKPENLVLDRDHRVIKLVDFGSAQMLGDHENVVMTNVEMRTTAYCPPEILLGNSYTKGKRSIQMFIYCSYVPTLETPSCRHVVHWLYSFCHVMVSSERGDIMGLY